MGSPPKEALPGMHSYQEMEVVPHQAKSNGGKVDPAQRTYLIE
jgi:hypothetical protein